MKFQKKLSSAVITTKDRRGSRKIGELHTGGNLSPIGQHLQPVATNQDGESRPGEENDRTFHQAKSRSASKEENMSYVDMIASKRGKNPMPKSIHQEKLDQISEIQKQQSYGNIRGFGAADAWGAAKLGQQPNVHNNDENKDLHLFTYEVSEDRLGRPV